MAIMDKPSARETVLATIESNGTLSDAGAKLEISGKTIARYAKASRTSDDPARRKFAGDLDTARMRRTQFKTLALPPRDEPDKPSRLEVAVTAAAVPSPLRFKSAEDFLLFLEEKADDDESPAQTTALRGLLGWWLEAPIAAKRKRAEREAEDTGDGGTVTRYAVALPEPDSGPGVDHEPDVIDAEIVEDE